jgi:hypothetical protein
MKLVALSVLLASLLETQSTREVDLKARIDATQHSPDNDEQLLEPMSWFSSSCEGSIVPKWFKRVLPPHAVKQDRAPCR